MEIAIGGSSTGGSEIGWMDCEAWKQLAGAAGGSEIEAPDEGGRTGEIAWGELPWGEGDGSAGRGGRTVKRGDSLGGGPLQEPRSKRRTKVDGL